MAKHVHVLAASSARYPRTRVACCENLPKFVRGKTQVGVPRSYCLPIHDMTGHDVMTQQKVCTTNTEIDINLGRG